MANEIKRALAILPNQLQLNAGISKLQIKFIER